MSLIYSVALKVGYASDFKICHIFSFWYSFIDEVHLADSTLLRNMQNKSQSGWTSNMKIWLQDRLTYVLGDQYEYSEHVSVIVSEKVRLTLTFIL